MQIFDAFLFFNELELLEIRLHELDPVVDRFILCEGTETFTGQPKPSIFLNNAERFARFLPKLTRVEVSDWPMEGDAWTREFHQRDALVRGIQGANGDDLVLLSDVDEIPSREAVAEMRGRPERSFAFPQIFSYFRFDFIRQNHGGPLSACTIAERVSVLAQETVSERRRSRIARCQAWLKGSNTDFHVFAEDGWHASYLGDDSFVRTKIQAFSHQEYNNPAFLEQIDIDRLLTEQADLFDRPHAIWRVATQPIKLPHLLREQPERFLHLFADARNLAA